jgi:putative membrane-bound dehydrogenase-like protein
MTFQFRALCLLCGSLIAGSSLAQDALTDVGAAKIDITPSYPIRLTGYGNRTRESEGVEEPIWAKAIAIGADEGEGPVVLITVENCGVPDAMVGEVATKLLASHKIPRERIVVSSSHSHSAPWVNGFAPFIFGADTPPDHQAHIDQYGKELIEKMVKVAVDALAARKPATLGWATGKVGFAANRRAMKGGVYQGFGVQPDGPVDHRLPILAAKDKEGKLVAVVANYACHCTTVTGDFNQISGDWLGHAMKQIEADHPGCVSLITVGCGADANPEPRGKVEQCHEHGRKFADEVKRLLSGKLTPIAVKIRAKQHRIELPFADLPSREDWESRAKEPGAVGYHGRHFLAKLDKGEKLPTSMPYVMSTWCFGEDLAMVFLAGEVVVDYAIAIGEHFQKDKIWITAYANDVPSYIASRRILREGGYEADQSMVYYARPTRLAGEAEDLILDSVQKLLPHAYYGEKKAYDFPGPKSPEESLKLFTLHPDQQIELVAAEPLVMDPIMIDWSPDGRMWVCEMADYPVGKFGGMEPCGRIRILTDVDGDGKYDEAKVFLDGIHFPTSLKVWRDGVLVTSAPNLFFARDKNGDGVADEVKDLYIGFEAGNPQHRVNGMQWSLDHTLALANGYAPGTAKSVKTGASVSLAGRDIFIQPDTGAIEPEMGLTQYIRSRDDWGLWFGNNNVNPLWSYPIEDRYLKRNPRVVSPGTALAPPREGTLPVYPTSRTLTRFNDFHTANHFTSACSPMVYRDQLLGEAFYGNIFISEPVHNLVSRQVVLKQGLHVRTDRAPEEQSSEFLSTTDNWSRPTYTVTGPDGALYVVDMYRQVIEHPEWVPGDWQRKLDLRAGEDRGRIYRIFPKGKRPRAIPKFDRATTEELIAHLEDSSGTVRDLATQVLIWRGNQTANGPLKKAVFESKNPLARLHALSALRALQGLDEDTLLQGLRDGEPGVVRLALRFAEPMAGKSEPIAAAILQLAKHSDERVRFSAVLALGEVDSAAAARALALRLFEDGANPHFRAAILTSIRPSHLQTVLSETLTESQPPLHVAEADEFLVRELARENPKAMAELAPTLFARAELSPRLLGLASGMLTGTTANRADLEKQLAPLQKKAEAAIADANTELELRVAAVRFVALFKRTKAEADWLIKRLAPQEPTELQLAAVNAATTEAFADAPDVLLSGWASHSPTLRRRILESLLSRADWAEAVLERIESKAIASQHLDADLRRRLVEYPADKIRDRARLLLSAAADANRAALVESYGDVAKMNGNATKGREVFVKRCGNCHVAEGKGYSVGPDLASLADRSGDTLLVAMLDPNRAVEQKYVEYLVTTNDGRQLIGILRRETPGHLILAAAENREMTIPRGEIEEIRASTKSFMPEGIEKDVSKQEIADVIAYLQMQRPPAKAFFGNEPRTIAASEAGTLELPANAASVHGPTLQYEAQYGNLGIWKSAADFGLFRGKSAKAGKFRVTLLYAAPPEIAGNRFHLSVGQNALEGAVQASTGWNDYRLRDAGILELPEGEFELTVRSAGPIKNALFDLRAITLVPVDK